MHLLKLISDFYSRIFYRPMLSGHRTSLEFVVMYQQGVPRVYDSHVEQRQCSKINSTLHNNNTLDLSRARFIGVLRWRISFLRIRRKYWAWNQPRLKMSGLRVREKQRIYFLNRTGIYFARKPSLQHYLLDLFATHNRRCNVLYLIRDIVLRRIAKKKKKK